MNNEKVAAVTNAVDFLLLPEWLEEQSAQQDRLDLHHQAWMHSWMVFEPLQKIGHEAAAGILASAYWEKCLTCFDEKSKP